MSMIFKSLSQQRYQNVLTVMAGARESTHDVGNTQEKKKNDPNIYPAFSIYDCEQIRGGNFVFTEMLPLINKDRVAE